MTVQERDPLLVVDPLVTAAVLGDDHGREPVAVALVEAGEQLGQRLGNHRPAEVRDRVALQLAYGEGEFGGQRQSAELDLRALGGAHLGRLVVVDAVPVQRLRDDLQVRLDVTGEQVGDAVRVLAKQQRVREQAVEEQVVEVGCLHVLRTVRRRPGRPVRVGDPDVGDSGRAQGPYGQTVCKQLVVGHRQGVEQQLLPRRVRTQRVAQQGVLGRLVEGDPLRDAVAEAGGDDGRVLGEALRRRPVQPVEVDGQVPVEEGRYGTYARRTEFVDETVVEVQAAGGVHPGPGDGEAVRVDAEVAQERDVLAVAVVVVAGHLGGGAVLHVAWFGGEGVPYRGGAFVGGPLDLVGRSGYAPEEGGRELREGLVAMRAIILTRSNGSQRAGVNCELRIRGAPCGVGGAVVGRLRAVGGWSRSSPRP